MNRFSIPHDALVFVGDGQKALFLRNAGDATLVNLTTERVFTDENPPTHDQGTDRPGRVFQSAAKNKRSGVETTDWHELEKERFAKRSLPPWSNWCARNGSRRSSSLLRRARSRSCATPFMPT
jgi:protein required for attachment to host cells